ncbi:hypothetical protein [Pseudorhodobacter sp.]|uniref:hypothetical protein n=1 Tax=Pseudorhodobacter sp. TaxID=1934400 RepID=UPI002648E392|nr:hypothetical protein [Pseudorhodobacter sp.]MDN5789176.1 hypothetical protein [Pseudorhodobacter sp.]
MQGEDRGGAHDLRQGQPPPSAGTVLQDGLVQSANFGAVLGVDSVGHCLALATIFFTGALSVGRGLATAVFVISSLCSILALYAFSQFRPVLGIAQDTSVAILAPAVSIAALGAAGPPQVQVATAFAAIGVAAVLSGIAFWLAGRLRLGRLLRMFPYPVAAGFLASSGFLLVYSAFVILTGARSYGAMALALAEPEVGFCVLAALAMAAALLIGMRMRNGTLLVVAIVLLFLAGFYGFTRLVGIDHDRAVALGLLSHTGSEGGLKPGLSGLASLRVVRQGVTDRLPGFVRPEPRVHVQASATRCRQ